MTISGLGPHGERAAPPERISLLPDDRIAAKSAGWRVAIVLHTLESDWAKQLVAGMVGIFGDCGAAVVDVVDCGFSPERQTAELDRLTADRPDAIISLPVANEQVAAAHARVSAAGIKLVLLDNAPTGLLPGKHYTALVSADNFGLGKIAAAGLSPHISDGSEVGVLGFSADFFATNEREIAFTKWLQANRPDITPRVRRFARIEDAAGDVMRPARKHPCKTQLVPDRGRIGSVRLAQAGLPVACRRQPVRGRLPHRVDQRRAAAGALGPQENRLEPIGAVEIGQPRIAGNRFGKLHFLRRKHQPRRRQGGKLHRLQRLRPR